MTAPIRPGSSPPYSVRNYHCQAIEEANRCDDNDQSCCLYCLPPVRDKCEIAPDNASLAVQWSGAVPVPLAADTWHEIDVTGAITGNGIYTLGLATVADQGNLDFWSRESIYSPVLEITFQP